MIFGVLHNPTYMTSLVHTPNRKFREVCLGGMDKNMSSFFFLLVKFWAFQCFFIAQGNARQHHFEKKTMFSCQICHISQQFVFCFQEEDSNFPSFMKISSSSTSIAKMKAPSSTSISSVGVSSSPSRTRESVVTISYSGARSSSELTLIESNVPKKRKC